ncbi:amidase [Patulibacter minatonensis]|uniref:amidase n=1 Tax=Patulibacter minatonensis TaxID=298163 RepID=UPI0004BBB2E8|nr:amidase [Patulibacter minatonensis]
MRDSSATADPVVDARVDADATSTDAPSSGLSRRSFVGRAGLIGAAGAVVASGALTTTARAADGDALPGLPSVAAVKARLETVRIVDLDVVELAALLQARELQAVDLANLYLARIDEFNGEFELYGDNGGYNAFVRIDRSDALAGAKAADERLDAAAAGGAPAPYLCGIPMGVKDSIGLKGRPAQNGTVAFRGNIANEDPPAVARLRAQGVVFLGHTICSSYSSSISGTFAGNAWDKRYVPGGSSQGSGVAPIIRFAAATLGEETGGSIIFPSAANGASGIKPSLGLSSVAGVMPLSPGTDVIGPISRSIRDSSLILNAMMGPDPTDDPQTLSQPMPFPALPIVPRTGSKPLAGLIIGVPQTDWLDVIGTAPQARYSTENLAVFNRVRQELTDLGAEVVNFRGLNMNAAAENPYLTNATVLDTVDGTNITPTTAVTNSYRADIRYTEAIAAFARTRGFDQQNALLGNYGRTASGATTSTFEAAAAFHRGISASARREGERRRRQMAANYAASLKTDGDGRPIDFMLVMNFGTKITLRGALPRYRTYYQGPNAKGWPMVSFPVGYSADEPVMPLSVQFFGPRFSEPAIVQAAIDYQAAFPEHHRRVPVDQPLKTTGFRRAPSAEDEVDPLASNDPELYDAAMPPQRP